MHDAAFGATAHGARDMQRGGLGRTARNDETGERFELGFGGVDGSLQLGDAFIIDARFLQLLPHLLVIRRGEQRTNREQIALNRHEHLVDARHEFDGPRQPQRRVQFIDVTVGLNTRVVFFDAATTKEARCTGVTGLRIDLHAKETNALPPWRKNGANPVKFVKMIHDITIIGGGPTGLFALFYAGMRGATAQIIDALPELGGQLTALYPEKYIFDVAGYPRVLAKDLVKNLAEQAGQFHRETGLPAHLNQRVVALEQEDDHYVLVTETGRFASRAIIIAAGIGAFKPRRLPQACAEPWYGRGIEDVVTHPDRFIGKRVVIIGGGDSAFDWAAQLRTRAAHVSLVHRSDRFRAHAATVSEVQAAAANGENVAIHTFHELDAVLPNGSDSLSGITLRDIKSKLTRDVECDVVLPMLGYVSDLGALGEWGLALEKDEIVVNSMMEAGRHGIYAAGDITTYPGKLKLIASGFSEAAVAVNQAVHWMYPEKKVAPGHSSNLAVFGQKAD